MNSEISDSKMFDMVAKTFQGLEDVLAEELRNLGALNVEPGRRMVSFQGDKAMLYKANLHCRTALRILKPFYSFRAYNSDKLYDRVKEFDWSQFLTPDKTFAIDVTVNSSEFTNSRFVTYRVKDAIVDWFRDRDPHGRRPSVRVTEADVMINVHISGVDITLSLDSSGQSLHKRGWRQGQTDAPINEVLAAGIILKSGWRGDSPFVDPMCGSGTFLIEAALIAANIAPGIFRRNFAFETWPDFDRDLWEQLYNDDSQERDIACEIIGADMSPKAIAIATENVKHAGMVDHITLQLKALSEWNEAPSGGVLVTNPPYGERLRPADLDELYHLLGSQLKHIFTGYHAWIIAYRDEQFAKIGLAPSSKTPLLNGSLECELREYIIFDGTRDDFKTQGGSLKSHLHRDDSRPGRRKEGHRRDFKPKDTPRPTPETPGGIVREENPYAVRRNPKLLETILNRPTAAPQAPRKGWRRKTDK